SDICTNFAMKSGKCSESLGAERCVPLAARGVRVAVEERSDARREPRVEVRLGLAQHGVPVAARREAFVAVVGKRRGQRKIAGEETGLRIPERMNLGERAPYRFTRARRQRSQLE